uniref:Phospholipid scramblase n=1 Tax=Chromera velia CCMP2878 TaxID=1169474 RepID=A0A0G4F518_9ALVE|eukprot:Cvel_2764.t1-p1 / transcript=Cvel_2764.t1 / gene=Cvel_2764 / organism=Chromera_velia_CCMP2878 / gene_product=hypothetical protein / transcript_product=hypothetical protein / location=Cvel_scaffold111:31153-32669(-) / protein_length=302 / sequence_SO=supercontig / SO=protein_coding / is_pseudo=false
MLKEEGEFERRPTAPRLELERVPMDPKKFGNEQSPASRSERVPLQQRMLADMEGFILKQDNSECCRCCCCQPEIDWRVYSYREDFSHEDLRDFKTLFFVKEKSPWCGRACSYCTPGARPITYEVFSGTQPVGVPVMTHRKRATNGVNVFLLATDGGSIRIPCCCNLPYLETWKGEELQGRTRYLCDEMCCVPKYAVSDASGRERYRIRPDTCCLGCCVACKCDGKNSKCCRIPFYLRDPQTDVKINNGNVAIEDRWAGLKAECCTRKNVYALPFPDDADDPMRNVLLGAAILVDVTVFEQDI